MKVNNWVYNSNNYRIAEVSQVVKKLPVGVYKTEVDRFEEIFLTKVSEEFEMPAKIYDVQRDFINRVHKSWANTTGNLGILLNGTRGTGKTITSEIIANETGLPVILVTANYKGLTSFLNEIQQDAVIFIDEYDKVFSKDSDTLLTVMDGALKTTSRFMFLLTSNENFLNQNMLQRPSRIRYVKKFGDLSVDAIMEVVDDMLLFPELKAKTIDFISHMPIITMDLVMSVIQEVNIHQEDPDAFKSVFNYRTDDTDVFTVYKIENQVVVETTSKAMLSHSLPFNSQDLEDDFRINYKDMGEIVEILSDNEVLVRKGVFDETIRDFKQSFVRYRVELSKRKHQAFNSLAF